MAGAGLPLMLSVVILPLTIRLMGLERFALLSLLWAALKTTSIPGAGYAGAMIRHISHELGGQARAHMLSAVIKTSFLMQLTLSCLVGCLLWAEAGYLANSVFKFSEPLRGEAVFAFRAAATILPVYAAGNLFSAVLTAHQRFRALNAVKLVFESLFLCLPPAVFAFGGGIREIVWAIMVGQLLSACAYFLLMKKKGMLREILFSQPELPGQLSTYAWWITLARACMAGAEESARFLAGALCGIPGLALYNIPHEIYTALSAIPSSFLSALFPAFSTACAKEAPDLLNACFYEYASKLFLLTALAFFGLILFAPEILLILTGTEQPAASVFTLQLLSLAEMAAGINYVGTGWFNGLNRPAVPARIYLVSFTFFLPACWIMVKHLGVVGAAEAILFKIFLENGLFIASAERGGASGRKNFIWTATGSLGLAACAALLSRTLPLASLYKTVLFLAALSGATGLLHAGVFPDLAPKRRRRTFSA